MEKHFFWGLGILVILLCAGLLTGWGMANLHREAESQLEEASRLALAGEETQAIDLARKAYGLWQRTRNLTALVADHSPMDDVETLFSEMDVYAQAGEIPHFAACCAQLSKLVRSMYEAHSPTWWNIL